MRELIKRLSSEDGAFLLTLLILGSEEDNQLIGYLSSERAQQLEEVRQKLDSQPRRQSLPLYIKELKYLIAESRKNPFEQFDPEWLAEFLSSESPRVISAILSQFSRSVAEKIYRNLPPKVQSKLPRTMFRLHPELTKRLLRLFSQKFHSFFPSDATKLSLESLAIIDSKDLFTILRQLGLRELAVAFSNVGKGPLMELCRRLGQEEANRLLELIRNLPPSSSQEIKQAQRNIRMISLTNRSRSEIIEEIGLGKLSEAIRELPERCKKAIALRLPRRLGLRLNSHRGLSLPPEDLYKLQKEILDLIQELARNEKISHHWALLEVQYPPPPPPEQNSEGEGEAESQLTPEGQLPPEESQ